MELSPLLQHFVDVGFRVAEDQFREGKEVCPQITLLAEDKEGMTIVPILSMVDVFGRKDSSRVVPGLIKYAWEGVRKERPHLKLLAITVMVDLWIKNMSVDDMKAQLTEGTFKRPSQSVGSTEAIIVQLTLEKEDILYQWPYVRGEEGVVFSSEPTLWNSEGSPRSLFMGLWPL